MAPAIFRLMNHPINWGMFIALFLFTWGTFLGADIAYRNNNTVFVDIFINMMPEKARKACRLACQILALIFMAAWHPLRRELLQLRPKGISLYVFATAIRAVYSIVLLTLGIAVMYKVFPHRKLRFLRQLPGAFFSAAAWYIFSMIVQLYVTKLKGFSTYGSLTTLMLVMFWLYFCCYFVMLGAEINEMLRRDGLLAKKKKQIKKPASE